MIEAINMALAGYFDDDDDDDFFNSESTKSYRENTPRNETTISDFNSFDFRRHICSILGLGFHSKSNEIYNEFSSKLVDGEFKKSMCSLFECSFNATNDDLLKTLFSVCP